MRYVESGVFKGSCIRRARKAGPCQYGRLRSGEEARCEKRIEVGDDYFEGDLNDFRAGGFARDRCCMDHLQHFPVTK